jgi:WD40 repeat protein
MRRAGLRSMSAVGRTFEGHTEAVVRVRTSPDERDGLWVASGCANCTARVWAVDAVSGAPAVAAVTGQGEGRGCQCAGRRAAVGW